MSCLNAQVYLLSEGIQTDVKQIDERIQVHVSEITERVTLFTKDTTKRMQINIGVICSLSNMKYLQVSPEEIQWITPEDDVIYVVQSNTDWDIIVDEK